MANCRYCTNYYLNGDNRVDDNCMGPGDVRKEYFSCNERLNPRKHEPEDYDTQEMIKELQKRGYKITHK